MRAVGELINDMLVVSICESTYKAVCWNGTDRIRIQVALENIGRVAFCAWVMDLTRWSFKCVYQSIGDDSVTDEQLYIVELQGVAFGYMIGKPLSSLIMRIVLDVLLDRDSFNYQNETGQERAEFRKKFRNTSENFTII